MKMPNTLRCVGNGVFRRLHTGSCHVTNFITRIPITYGKLFGNAQLSNQRSELKSMKTSIAGHAHLLHYEDREG